MFKIGFLIISFELAPHPVPPEQPRPVIDKTVSNAAPCANMLAPGASERTPGAEKDVRKSDYFRNPTSAELDELEKRYGYQKNVWGI